ncbi:MAG: hypothetical protein Q8Q63_12800 [Phaeovulum sp.]|uniref:hypothetical protein n=1 Tax=Phaeovulum sp. TaxID=2934796 RepID=UPI002733F910|nr:hypothetical protein [Phaeovulum sp.]MDP3862451.1 hypothetical protein [Phaeovulum sp.]
MLRKFATALAVAALLAGCAIGFEVATPFNAAEVAYINRSGPAKITGQAFTRLPNGLVITCAGTDVQLVPAGSYAKERIASLYGTAGGGRMSVAQPISVANSPPEYATMRRVAICDAGGNFEFAGVADGEYYVMTVVQWVPGPGRVPEGVRMVSLVRVANGQSVRVIMN